MRVGMCRSPLVGRSTSSSQTTPYRVLAWDSWRRSRATPRIARLRDRLDPVRSGRAPGLRDEGGQRRPTTSRTSWALCSSPLPPHPTPLSGTPGSHLLDITVGPVRLVVGLRAVRLAPCCSTSAPAPPSLHSLCRARHREFVWQPDVFGSLCFPRWPQRSPSSPPRTSTGCGIRTRRNWAIGTWLGAIGSVAFGVSAAGALLVPERIGGERDGREPRHADRGAVFPGRGTVDAAVVAPVATGAGTGRSSDRDSARSAAARSISR